MCSNTNWYQESTAALTDHIVSTDQHAQLLRPFLRTSASYVQIKNHHAWHSSVHKDIITDWCILLRVAVASCWDRLSVVVWLKSSSITMQCGTRKLLLLLFQMLTKLLLLLCASTFLAS